MKKRSKRVARAPRALDSLEMRLHLASDLDAALQDKIRNTSNAIFSAVDAVHDRIFNNALARTLPLVGDALKVLDGPADKFKNVAQDIQQRINELVSDTEITSADVQQKLFNAVQPILDGINAPGQIPTNLLSALECEFTLPIKGTLVQLSEKPDFFLGLPGLNLSLPPGLTKVDVALTYEIELKLGFSASDGFYINLDTSGLGEAQLHLNVSTPNFDLRGNLFFLKFQATNTDKPFNQNDPRTHPTHFDARFALDFTDGPDAGSRLTSNEIGQVGLVPKMQGDMRFNVKANVDFGSGKFPRLDGYINLGWSFGNTAFPNDIVSYIECSNSVPANQFGAVPTMEVNDVTLDAGTFFSNMVKPVFEEVNKVFKPVKPFVDMLYKRIDWLTDVHDDIIDSFHNIDHDNSGDISVRDLIQEVNLPVPFKFLDTFKKFLDVFGSFDVPNTGGYKIPLGRFNLLSNQLNGGGLPDLRGLTNLLNVNLTTFDTNDPEGTLRQFAIDNGFGDIVKFLDDIGANEFLPTPRGKGMQFPLLEEPKVALKLFLGQDVELFTFDMDPIETPETEPKLRAAIQVPILDIIHIGIRGSLGQDVYLKFKAKFAFGYDTRGLVRTLQTGDVSKLFEGFYVSDRKNPDGSGEDVNEIDFKLGIEGFAGVGIPGFSVDVGAGPRGNITMNLRDFDNDGKVRPSELAQAFDQGPLCFMDIAGDLKFIFRVTLTNPLKDLHYNIAEQTLFSFDNYQCGTGADEPVLAEMTGQTQGQLRLNTGTFAPARLRVNTEDTDEKFVVTHIGTADDGSDTISIQAFGIEQFYTGVRSLYIEGGAGNDQIYIDGDFTKPVVLYGDFDPVAHPDKANVIGNDVIYSGGGLSTLYGGGGNDQLVARTAGAVIFGQDGDDTMHGSPGNDCLLGGAGNDVVYGNDGNDTIFGEAGADFLYGMEGDDTIDGGTEDDQLYGFDGNDTLTGANGNDRLFGERGDDRVFGGSGNDVAFGNEGNDCIAGDDGIDSLVGGSEDDTVIGGAQNDLMLGDDADVDLAGGFTLFGGSGNDSMSGGGHDDRMCAQAGNDTVSGGLGNDTVIGAAGADSISGDQGNDNISGDEDPDTIAGGDGGDMITGNAGADFITGDAGADFITGNDDNDTVTGGADGDTITGDLGGDSITGDAGADSITGHDGNDTLHGGAENDTIIAGAGTDSVTGDDGADSITGDGADDTIQGGTGNDTITGNDGADSIQGDQGDDSIAGGNAADTISGGTENDFVTGDAGADSIAGDAGNDTIVGGTENDTIAGGTENDSITGDSGIDSITAGAGDDFVSGGTENDEIRGGGGADTIQGDAGSDRAWGGTENDSISGGTESDILRGEAGDDTVFGGDAPDLIEGGVGHDCISGDAGPDRIYAGRGNDTVAGGSEDDTAQGEAGNDLITGGPGNDLLDGAEGADTLGGDAGNDTLLAGSGVGDQLLGGDNDDKIVGSDEGAETDPNFLDATYFGDVIDGGAGNDTIDALGGADNVQGGDGDDSVNSGQGSDFVRGGTGHDYLYAGRGRGDSTSGDAGNDTIYGSAEGADSAAGGDGDDQIFGQGGNDNLTGDAGRDYIDAGTGVDTASGGADNDEIRGGGGNLDNLGGDDGDDLIRGSNDGADVISGGAGRDRIFANAGNDTVTAGAGSDTVEGGAGDDNISGDAGSDLIVGGANHDILYGHSASGAGDDNAVDTLYGDFGSGGSEPDQGRDQLLGQGGNDLLFGEGDDDLINPGGGTSNVVNYGSGEGPDPADFVPPGVTPPPTLGSGTSITQAQPTLPTGPNYAGRWTQFGSSATGPGVSNSRALAVESSVAVDPAGNQYVAWADARNGNYEIYVAKRTANGGWSQFGGSAGEGGISNTTASSRRPSIAIGGDGQPMVAWTETVGGAKRIRAARFDPAGNGGNGIWIDLGFSAVGGDYPILLNTTAGPVVVHLTDGTSNTVIYASVFSGGTWTGLGGAQFNSGTGVSGIVSQSVETFSATTNGAKVAVAWTFDSGPSDILFREFSAGAWTGTQAVEATIGNSTQPTVAYLANEAFVAWQDDSSGHPEIRAARSSTFAVWLTVGVVSNTQGEASQPRLASANGQLHLLWVDDTLANRTGQSASLYARKWNGSAFVAETVGDVTSIGLTSVVNPASLSFTTNSQGQPFIGWTDQNTGAPQIDLRGNTHSITGNIYTASAATSVQSILDSFDLNPGDAIVIDGAVPGFSLGAQDSGVTIIGLPGSSVTSPININSATDVVLQRVNGGAIIFNLGARFTLRESSVGAVTLNSTTDAVIANSTITGALTLAGATNPAIEHNSITAGVSVNATNLLLRDNKIAGTTGVNIAAASSGTITANDIAATGEGMILGSPFTGSIDHNDVHNATVGVRYNVGADLSANIIHHNTTGIISTVIGASALGFVSPSSAPNHIHSNTTGVSLTNGRMQNQRIDSNTVGVTGLGILGPDSLALANLIERNATGVDGFFGPIQFNRIARNATGIAASSNQLIHHNLIYKNASAGLRVNGKSDVRVVQNTFHTFEGDNVRVEAASSNVQLLNNIMVAEGGYDIYVADNARAGFFSDHNTLHSTGTGKILHWLKDFNDILDIQADLALFDLHSIGTTAVNPMWAAPAFANSTLDDYAILTHSAAQRHTSPTLDAGAPFIDLALPAGYTNLLANPSFESNLTGWTTNPGATAQTGTAFEGTKYFHGGNVAAGIAELTVDLTAAGYSAAQLDSEDFALVFGGRVRTTDDTGFVTLTFLGASAVAISTVTLPLSNTTDRWELVGDRRQIPAGTRSVRLRFEGTRLAGNSNDTVVDAAFVYVLAENIAPDQGAYGNAPTDIDSNQRRIAVRSPDLYVDWDLTRPHIIRWDTYGNAADSQVRIDLYQDTANGPALIANITPSTQDDGLFDWIPQNTPGLTAGMLGLRIHISAVADNILFDRGQEYFAIPESGTDYYVDDASNANDQFTPAAVGNNRNTGKTAATPKPLLTTLLRAYDLGPADDVHIDTGNYQHFASAVISGTTGIGDDEGVTIAGPDAASNIARIDPLGISGGALFDINDGDFVTLRRLTLGALTNAISLRNSSINFTGSHLTTSGNSQDAILIDSNSIGSAWDHLNISGSGRHGINSATPVTSLTDSRFASNAASAIFLTNAGPVVIEANDISGGTRGISISNAGTAVAVIGNTNLALSRGNKIHHNSEYGIDAGLNVLVTGNTINNNFLAGVNVLANGTVSQNVIFDNYDGIRGGSPSFNRIFHNANAGIVSFNGAGPMVGNVIYSNNFGVVVNFAANASSLDGPFLSNNLIYANSLRGVQVNGSRNAQIFSNTIYQPVGDAIRIDPGSAGNGSIQIRNNILAVGADYALNVNPASQSAVTSDSNDFVLFGSGKTGFWSGAARSTLAQWRSASLQDQNALAVDPMFNDVDGGDNTLGWSFTSDGRDDDFHLKSAAGSYKNGALAPVVDSVTGLPVMLAGSYSNDAATSPLIDRGDPNFSFANEPAPNGGFPNVGAYANTTQASKSVVPYVTVTVPVGGEIRPVGQNLSTKWRSHDFTGAVDVELWRAGGVSPVLVIADDTANDGAFDWVVPSGLASASDYFIRVRRTGASGDSPLFSISPPTQFYYVNDNAHAPGDVTSAEGNDDNSGTDAAHPKATIADVLNDYDLGPGDVIIVDAGAYILANNIVITNQDSGVTISGAQAPSRPVVNRNNTAAGSYAFQLTDADNISITGLKVTGAERAIYASNTSDSDNLTISANDITGNAYYGIHIEATNDNATITHNDVHDNAGGFGTYGISFLGSGVISANRVYKNTRYGIEVNSNLNNNVITVSGNDVYQNTDRGISAGYSGQSSDGVIPAGTFISGNTIHDNGNTDLYFISTYKSSIASDNTVYGAPIGIELAGAAEAKSNIVYGHQTGIAAGSGFVTENRVYGNTLRGVLANVTATVFGNRIYSNGGGIEGDAGGSPVYRNNLVYNNALFGISLRSGNSAVIENNTVYQPSGDAFRLLGTGNNVRAANNIFAAGSGYAMRVESLSLSNYVSDYNDIVVFGPGKFARLDNREFLSRADWLYELGLDAHSTTSDPRFVDIDGADDLLGAGVRGLTASIFNNTTFSGTPAVTRIDPKIEFNFFSSAPDSAVGNDNFSIRWTGYIYVPTAGIYTFYSQADDGERLVIDSSTLFNNFTFNLGGAEESATLALTAGWHAITYEMVETTGSAQAFVRWSGPGIARQIIQPTNLSPTLPGGAPGDFGADDDFHLRSDSPAIDSGDPDSLAVSEPLPNGSRINQGNYGNTREATTSPLQFVQVTLPNGLERVDAGTQLNIQWRSGGLTQNTYLAMINLNGPKIGEWKPTAFGLVTPFAGSITNTINTSGVTNPAPAAVYQTYQYAESGIGKKLAYLIPVSDGSYTLRLHFAEPVNLGTNQRKFDIKINGLTLQANYDVFATAGGAFKAVTASFPVTASAAAGILLELVNTTSNPAFLNAIEITGASPGGVANPTADLEYSIDGGANWLSIASDQPIDIYGKGSFNWTVPNTPSENVLVRVRADNGTQPSDLSDAVFVINPTTNHYYINDNSTAGDVFTTAVGNNANSGKSPDRPMASLGALLAAYDLSPGDIVHVDSGTYNQLNTIFLNSDDSGIVIEGPQGGTALFTRGGAASPVFLLNGADDLMLDRLSITGGNYGIQSVFTPTNRSDNVTLSSLDVYGNTTYGLYLYSFDATGISVLNSKFHNNGQAIEVNYAVNFAAIGNSVYNNTGRAVNIATFGGTVSGNAAFGNVYGIDASSRNPSDPAARVTVSGNTVHNNTYGITIGANVVAENNTASGHTTNAGYGMRGLGGIIQNNTVFGNYDGITGAALIQGNLVHDNINAGISANESSQINRNAVYKNRYGIVINNTYGASSARNNLVYGNTDLGIALRYGRGSEIIGNTIYQPTGDGLAIDGAAYEMTVKSNIFQLNSGIAITVTNDSGTGMISDFNNFYLTGTARMGKWHNREYATRADWYLEHYLDAHSISANPQFVDPDGIDNILGNTDDNFTLAPTSPSIDKGDSAAAFLAEPGPNGGRVNQGHDGNSSNATPSSAQAIHLIGPNGYDKLEAGHVYPIEWRSSGLRQTQTIALINGGGGQVGDWSPGQYQVGLVNTTTGSITDTSLVTNPPPLDVYKTLTYANNGIGNKLAYQLPVQDGQYTLRFHFQESFVSAGQRKFDIRINGAVVRSDFDVYATAGTYYKAVALSFNATATGGTGLLVEFVNKTANPAFVCGIEVAAANAALPANPTADIQFSTDNGANWTTIATNQPMDSLGRGVFNWTPSTPTTGNTALIRVVSSMNPAIADQSDAAFLVANGGNHYYVNDASTAGDALTTAVGSNYNSGKSPESPMANLHSLLLHYDLDAGDVIHIENGTYMLVRNIVITSDDSGMTVQGPSTGAATFNRQTNADTYFIFDFAGADDVTLDRLKLTNAWIGVRLYFDQNSDRVTISNSEISQMTYRGIQIANTNDDATISNNSIHDIAGFAPWAIDVVSGARAVITGNTIFNAVNGGITVAGSTTPSTISRNTIYGSGTGIYSNAAIISDNLVRNNTNGISVDGASVIALRNVAHSNQVGILNAVNAGGVIDSNRVYNNSSAGIVARGNGVVRNNSVYSNPIGILGEIYGTPFTGQILSNFVYANTNFGIQLTSANGASIINNTVYQIVGDAVRLGGSSNITLRNNILWTDAGAAIFVNTDSQTGFNSDYNLLHKGAGGAASIGSWAGVARPDLAAWQTATGHDSHSISANPALVDLDGADNVLGYVTTGGGYDGGLDDNPYLSKTSPAIDRGDSWKLAHFDKDGANRFDEPSTSNLGPNDYKQTTAATQFSATGTARNFKSQNSAFQLTLPFAFPFYDGNYNTVYVGTNGVLEFGGGTTIVYDPANSFDKLITRRAIAPLWDNLRTNGVAANDVFVDTSAAGQVKIRWNATHVDTNQQVNFAVVLFTDGRIRFDYGAGNTGLSPTVGISHGNGQAWQLTTGDGATTLTNANSVEWMQVAGFVDLGAYEFRGQTTDVTPPIVTAGVPSQVFSGGIGPTTNKIDLIFSEPLNSIDARALSNYLLIAAGPNGTFGDSDDFSIPFTPVYVVDSSKVTLQLNGHLAPGMYRLTAYGSAGAALRDLSGNKLAGDFVKTFQVGPPVIITPANNINSAAAPMSIKYQFSADVGGSLTRDDLILTSGGGVISPNQMTFNYDPVTFTATWTFSGLPGGVLPDGNYRASILASSVTDGAGQPLASNLSQNFSILNCDFNRDGVVNYLDFNVLYANFGRSGTHDIGDANFDGKVNFADFQKLETAFGRSAAALPPAAAAPPSASGPEVLASAKTPLPKEPVTKPAAQKSSLWNVSTKVVSPNSGFARPARSPLRKRLIATHTDISALVSPTGEILGESKVYGKVFNQKPDAGTPGTAHKVRLSRD